MAKTVVAVALKDGIVVGVATNEHLEPCKREGYPTGEGYELCEWCDYPNHAEAKLCERIEPGCEVLIIGHTYACDPCISKMKVAGVTGIRFV